MTKYAIQPDGTVVPHEDALTNKNWEGGVKLEEEKSDEVLLSKEQLAQITIFVGKNKSWYDCKDPEKRVKRREMLYERAKAEMVALNKEDEKRQEQGQPKLTAEERKLMLFEGGVVRSSWKNEQIKQMARDEFKTYKDAKRGNEA